MVSRALRQQSDRSSGPLSSRLRRQAESCNYTFEEAGPGGVGRGGLGRCGPLWGGAGRVQQCGAGSCCVLASFLVGGSYAVSAQGPPPEQPLPQRSAPLTLGGWHSQAERRRRVARLDDSVFRSSSRRGPHRSIKAVRTGRVAPRRLLAEGRNLGAPTTTRLPRRH